ncbi:MAG TPA: glycosyltransferase family 39 protein [Acidobacteriota bacterium]|nr:glycosyltransferase family 39 protein [Acidobacteriota bacterium]
MNERVRAGYVLLLVALLLVLINFFWLRADTRPWIWDMGFHTRLGLDYLEWAQHPSLDKLRWVYQESLWYPPFYHWAEAISFTIAGRMEDAAAFPNFFFLGLMLWAVFRIGERVDGVEAGLWGALFTSLFPILVWLSRTPLVDFALVAVVCQAIHFLLETENFGLRKRSILFGLVCGIGMLVKWSFLFFLAGPILYVYFQRPTWRHRVCQTNIVLALVTGAVVASIWYLAKVHLLLFEYFPEHAAQGIAEGDPPVWSPVSWIFYLQLLFSYQLFFPLALLLALGIYWSFYRGEHAHSLAVIWVWLGSSWLILTLLRNKDPRYTAPLLPAVAILAAAGLVRSDPVRNAVRRAALAVALAQFMIITFNVPFVPDKVSLGTFHRGTYNWEWQIYSKTYQGFLGPSRDEEWPMDSVLSVIAEKGGGRLFVLPDHPYFSAEVFLYRARLLQSPVEVSTLRSGNFHGGERDFLIVKTGDQGDPRTTQGVLAMTSQVEKDSNMHLLRAYTLPDGSQGLLYASKKLEF